MAASLATLRPTFDRFYSLLNDEQKARLVAMTLSKVTAPQSEERTRFRENRDQAHRPGSSGDGSYCQQWVKYLRSWPIRQIEFERLSLTTNALLSMTLLPRYIERPAN
jgi:hypothetical protein